MGEMNNIPLLMGMEAQTRSSHSMPMIPIFGDTNMDTHLALSASPWRLLMISEQKSGKGICHASLILEKLMLML